MRWVKMYKESGGKLESLSNQDRSDSGSTRSIDEETGLALIRLRQEFPKSYEVSKQELRLPRIALARRLAPRDGGTTRCRRWRLVRLGPVNLAAVDQGAVLGVQAEVGAALADRSSRPVARQLTAFKAQDYRRRVGTKSLRENVVKMLISKGVSARQENA